MGTGARSGAPVVTVIGGGQLARMMAEAASPLGIELRAVVEAADGSAGQVLPYAVVGQPDELEKIKDLADGSPVTVEHEHVPAEVLDALGAQPSSGALRFAQNKIALRSELEGPMPAWSVVDSAAGLDEAIASLGGEAVVKAPTGGYDGKGVAFARSSSDVPFFVEGEPVLVEEKIDFDMEVAVLLARSVSGEIAVWPLCQTIQKSGICFEVIAPAQVDDDLAEQAEKIARSIAEQTGVVGVLAVEMFVASGKLYLNELAMRPHNSGHWTIDGSATSQFEQHLRAVLDLPLGPTDMTEDYAVMVNILGSTLDDPRQAYATLWREEPRAKVHMYGKEVRPGRKIGHVTTTGSNLEQCRKQAHHAEEILGGRS